MIREVVRKAEKISGFMDRGDLIWLANIAKHKNTVVEFGSWMGRSSVALASFCQRLICVDTFCGSPNDITGELAKANNIYDRFKKNTEGYNIEVVAMPIDKATEFIFNNYGPIVDLIFIDANHSYKNVCNDILCARSLVNKDGIICGHDIRSNAVRMAVSEAFADNYSKTKNNIWYQKRQYN